MTHHETPTGDGEQQPLPTGWDTLGQSETDLEPKSIRERSVALRLSLPGKLFASTIDIARVEGCTPGDIAQKALREYTSKRFADLAFRKKLAELKQEQEHLLPPPPPHQEIGRPKITPDQLTQSQDYWKQAFVLLLDVYERYERGSDEQIELQKTLRDILRGGQGEGAKNPLQDVALQSQVAEMIAKSYPPLDPESPEDKERVKDEISRLARLYGLPESSFSYIFNLSFSTPFTTAQLARAVAYGGSHKKPYIPRDDQILSHDLKLFGRYVRGWRSSSTKTP